LEVQLCLEEMAPGRPPDVLRGVAG
jgi:hypothetical protein